MRIDIVETDLFINYLSDALKMDNWKISILFAPLGGDLNWVNKSIFDVTI